MATIKVYKGFIVIASAMTINLLGYLYIDNPILSFFSWFSIVPIIHGSHAAIHRTLVKPLKRTPKSILFNECFAFIGYGFQFMNYDLLRTAHLHHHFEGRLDQLGAPDVWYRRPNLVVYLKYYLNLIIFPALYWQLMSIAIVFVPNIHSKTRFKFRIKKYGNVLVLAFNAVLVYIFIHKGGLIKFAIYDIFICIIWSVSQNVAHYGLRGRDEFTNKICAHTYFVEPFFNLLTFGSLSHLAHHLYMDIPGELLNTETVIKRVEKRLNLKVEIKYGIISYLKDLCAQFKGPISSDSLKESWFRDL